MVHAKALDTLQSARLYGIVDTGYVREDEVAMATRRLCAAGVDVLQLRAKRHGPDKVEFLARGMLPVTREFGVPLVINDHPGVAAVVGSEGVHVGQDDLSMAETRVIVGPGCFVGKSTHSRDQATAAMREGADYIGFGPLYATGTKPDYTPIGLDDIAWVHERATCPVFCIGGVNLDRLEEIVAAGAKRVVIVSALLQAPDAEAYVREVKARLAEI
jgi:thiamine-phosphate pyrophosphorylase